MTIKLASLKLRPSTGPLIAPRTFLLLISCALTACTTSVAATNLHSPLDAPGQNYTVAAVHLTMHVGDPLPPLIFKISAYTGTYAALFKGQPALRTMANPGSAVGDYPIVISKGSMQAVNSGDTLTFQDSTLSVIAQDGIGAKLVNGVAVPPGFFSGPAFGMINVKSNPIANLAGDGKADDTDSLQALLAWGRCIQKAVVEVRGQNVTATSGITFDGLSGPVQINGVIAIIKSVSDSTHLTLTSSLGILPHALLRPGGNIVATSSSGNVVSASSGPTFEGIPPRTPILINGIAYSVAHVSDSTHLVTNEALPDQANVKAYAGPPASAWGRQMLQLYFPPGTYLVSKQLQMYGNYWTLQGDGPQTSVIRLMSNSPAFNGSNKAYLFAYSSVHSNDNFRTLIANLGFAAGPGNPQAEVVHWVNNNMGSIRNTQIWCDDSNCLFGLGLEGGYAGPTFIKNLAIYGAKYGVQANGQVEYQATLESLTTEGQLTASVSNGSYKLVLRHWLNDSSVPGLIATGNLGHTVVMDSRLTFTGSGKVAGISNTSSGVVYGRDITCKGYDPCTAGLDTGAKSSRAATLTEFWNGHEQTIFDQADESGSLKLPVSETPLPSDPCTRASCDWQQMGPDPSTWPATVASATSSSLYLPPGAYSSQGSTTITVPDSVNYINLNNAQFNLASNKAKLFVNVAGFAKTPLIIDGCMYSSCYINHTGKRTLVLRDNYFSYQSSPGAGNVYIEDGVVVSYATGNNTGEGPTFYAGQSVWARSLNIEVGNPNDLRFNKFVCDGAKLWIMGYKTEQDSPSVVLRNACEAEIFGFFFYQLHFNPTPAGEAPILVTDSSLFATGFIFVNQAQFGAQNWINESRNGVSRSLPSATYPNSTSELLSVFYTHGAKAHVPHEARLASH